MEADVSEPGTPDGLMGNAALRISLPLAMNRVAEAAEAVSPTEAFGDDGVLAVQHASGGSASIAEGLHPHDGFNPPQPPFCKGG